MTETIILTLAVGASFIGIALLGLALYTLNDDRPRDAAAQG